jgi:acetyl esterase/lipase
MKRILPVIILIMMTLTIEAQQPVVIDLWPNGTPKQQRPHRRRTKLDNGRVANVTKPTLTVYPARNSNGMVVIACPGGAYIRLAMQHEGHDMAPWFNMQGVTFAVLKYRMPNGNFEAPLSDVQQAISLIRQRAAEWGVAPNKIGIMGASAGGHLASTAATHFTSKENRPDFQILLYPAIKLHKVFAGIMFGDKLTDEMMNKYTNDLQVTPETPQAIIFNSSDDLTVPPDHAIRYYKALIANKVPASLHLYPTGGHGWGYKEDFIYKRQWTDELEKCLREINK